MFLQFTSQGSYSSAHRLTHVDPFDPSLALSEQSTKIVKYLAGAVAVSHNVVQSSPDLRNIGARPRQKSQPRRTVGYDCRQRLPDLMSNGGDHGLQAHQLIGPFAFQH